MRLAARPSAALRAAACSVETGVVEEQRTRRSPTPLRRPSARLATRAKLASAVNGAQACMIAHAEVAGLLPSTLYVRRHIYYTPFLFEFSSRQVELVVHEFTLATSA